MDYKLAFQYMFWSLMTHITSRLFNTFTFIFIQLSCSMAFMPAWTMPLNQLIVIIAFGSQFESLSVSLSFAYI